MRIDKGLLLALGGAACIWAFAMIQDIGLVPMLLLILGMALIAHGASYDR